jgi:hypothetical protein
MTQSIHLSKKDGKAEIARKYFEGLGPAPIERLDAEDAVRIGVVALGSEDWRTAVRFLRQAIEKNPQDHRAYFFRSVAWAKILRSVTSTPDQALTAARQGQRDAETTLELIAEREREFAERIRDGERGSGIYWERLDAVEEDKAEYKELSVQREEALRLRSDFRTLVAELEGAPAPSQPPQPPR